MSGTRNKMQDMQNHLFDSMERLMEADDDKELEKEVKRARGISELAGKLIESAKIEVTMMVRLSDDVKKKPRTNFLLEK